MAPSANSPLANFNKMPTTSKAGVFIIAGALLGLIYWQLVFKSLDQNLEDARSDHDAKVLQNKKLADDIPKYAALKAQMKELTQKINENQKALPTETELPAFFETINRKVIESGVEMLRSDKKAEENLEGFVKVPIQIEITGTFMQIKRFFASLAQKDMSSVKMKSDGVEERERIISIENLAIANPTLKNREIVLDVTFTAATFRQEDQVPAGVGSGSAAPAGQPGQPPPPAQPPAPKPPTSAPLPSATTPAGAKARVENALEKGDERNRNAGGADEAKTPAGGGSDRLKGGM